MYLLIYLKPQDTHFELPGAFLFEPHCVTWCMYTGQQFSHAIMSLYIFFVLIRSTREKRLNCDDSLDDHPLIFSTSKRRKHSASRAQTLRMYFIVKLEVFVHSFMLKQRPYLCRYFMLLHGGNVKYKWNETSTF